MNSDEQDCFDGPGYQCELCSRWLRLTRFNNLGFAVEIEPRQNETFETASNITSYRHHCPVLEQHPKYEEPKEMDIVEIRERDKSCTCTQTNANQKTWCFVCRSRVL